MERDGCHAPYTFVYAARVPVTGYDALFILMSHCSRESAPWLQYTYVLSLQRGRINASNTWRTSSSCSCVHQVNSSLQFCRVVGRHFTIHTRFGTIIYTIYIADFILRYVYLCSGLVDCWTAKTYYRGTNKPLMSSSIVGVNVCLRKQSNS